MTAPFTAHPMNEETEQQKKALEILDKMDIRERIQSRRKAPNLSLTLTPLWIWCLGMLYLPEGMPLFARAMFHATCWAGFLWLAFQTWQAYQDQKVINKVQAKVNKRKAFLEAANKRKKR